MTLQDDLDYQLTLKKWAKREREKIIKSGMSNEIDINLTMKHIEESIKKLKKILKKT